MRSTKTTAAGLFGGLALLGSVLARVFGEGGGGLAALIDPANLGQVGAAAGAIALGLWARDDGVTSEGTKAPKKPED